MAAPVGKDSAPPAGTRLSGVLESALETFARQGYRRTSMEDVARRARISRPGLYLYFSSKRDLLRSAVEHALSRDVAAAETVLADARAPLRTRLVGALDLWAGQYVGPLAADMDGLLEQDATLLGDLPRIYAERFGSAVVRALAADAGLAATAVVRTPADAEAVRDVVLALSAGIKHQAADRDDFRVRLERGLALLLR